MKRDLRGRNHDRWRSIQSDDEDCERVLAVLPSIVIAFQVAGETMMFNGGSDLQQLRE
jgi:hypothetical protein